MMLHRTRWLTLHRIGAARPSLFCWQAWSQNRNGALDFLVLTRFLHANRYPPRIKWGRLSLENASERSPDLDRGSGLFSDYPNSSNHPADHNLAYRVSISGHDLGSRRRDHQGERKMPAQRVWKSVGPVESNTEIEHLRLELASFNERIKELEQQHPDALKIELLKTSALMLARQIDEIRCPGTNELTHLLAK
jgi:hypothetical protein